MSWIVPEGNDFVEHVTEDAVAVRVAEQAAGRLRYCHDAQAWFVWDGVAWRQDRTRQAFHRMREIARATAIDPFGKARAMPGSLRFLTNAERLARSDPAFAVTAAAWDADPFLLGTPGGTVRLRTGDVVEADPRDGISRTTNVAPADTAACPLWRQALDEMTAGDATMVRFLQQVLGYVLSGAVDERLLLFIADSGGDGAMLLTVVAGILGDYARPMVIGAGAVPTETVPRGTRLVVARDVGSSRPWPATLVTSFSDDMTLSHGGQIVRSTAKLLAYGPAPPALHHLDPALCERIVVVPIRGRSGLARAALEAERPAILRWMIDGCLDWQANGLVRPAALDEATRRALAAHDIFDQFLDEACIRGPDARTGRAPAGMLFAAWRAYADAAGERPGSPRTFAQALQQRGFTRDRLASGRIFRGLELRSGAQEHDGMTA